MQTSAVGLSHHYVLSPYAVLSIISRTSTPRTLRSLCLHRAVHPPCPALPRLERDFGHPPLDPDSPNHREEVMTALLECYTKEPPRRVRFVAGTPVSLAVLDALRHECCHCVAWPTGKLREWPTIRAEGYMILRSPAEFSKKNSKKALLAAKKVQKLCSKEESDPPPPTLFREGKFFRHRSTSRTSLALSACHAMTITRRP